MMKAPSGWPEGLDAVWAKSPARGQATGETLVEHTWAVLERVAALARLRPNLASWAGLPQLWTLLFWAGLLHDWGKGARGFQAALRGGPRWRHRHEVLSLLFLDWLEPQLEPRDAAWLACAIAMHHKDAAELKQLYPSGLDPDEDPLAHLLAELDVATVRLLWQWQANVAVSWAAALGLPAPDVHALPTADAAVAGLERGYASLARWIKRSYGLLRELEPNEAVSLRIAGLLLRGYLIQADHVASAHAPALEPPRLQHGAVLDAARVPASGLYPHQQQAAATAGSALLIAPTGSGKTEAALLWAARQAAEPGGVARLFYTLPYQASMNAMYDRLTGVFPGQVGLLHGRSALALYRRLMDDRYEPSQAALLARSLQSLAALQVPPVRVFSPYHMLKAAYQLKGYEAMLADYAGSAFVFDEIHAYEPERLAMILETVRYLRERLGCLFFVMSATLPPVVQNRVRDALNSPGTIRASPDLFRAFQRHRARLLAGELLDPDNLERIACAFRDGQSVLVVCNTVARAQQAYQALLQQQSIAEHHLTLIHGRFTGRDRLSKERELLAAAGLATGHHEPVIVVATQVVEVSLNLDLDTIFTDPAPLEALVQRFGRVNRRRRLSSAPVHIFLEPADGQGVYSTDMVRATLDILLAQGEDQPLDEALLEEWLGRIYDGAILGSWEERYQSSSREFRASFLDPLRPFSTDEGLEEQFARLFDGLEVLPACLQSEFLNLLEERPLEAAELLVPVSWRRWKGLLRQGRVRSPPGSWPPVVDAAYSSRTGLQFD